jgi:hypothetical protein
MLKLFATDWFEGAFERVRDLQVSRSVGARLQVDAPQGRCHLVIEEGRIVRWAPGDVEAPDVELRWVDDTAARVLRRDLRGNDALIATEVRAPADGSDYIGTPAPLNLLTRREASSLPTLPGASLSVQYTYPEGPFGTVEYALEFEDGQIVDERLATIDLPDAHVEVSYLTMARVRAGEMTILEALDGSKIQGELGPLAALAGISESPEFHAVELATGRHALALGALGLFDADPAFAHGMVELAARTETS